LDFRNDYHQEIGEIKKKSSKPSDLEDQLLKQVIEKSKFIK
jgi:hypothetical protein